MTLDMLGQKDFDDVVMASFTTTCRKAAGLPGLAVMHGKLLRAKMQTSRCPRPSWQGLDRDTYWVAFQLAIDMQIFPDTAGPGKWAVLQQVGGSGSP